MWFVMVPAAGVEPATFRSGGKRRLIRPHSPTYNLTKIQLIH